MVTYLSKLAPSLSETVAPLRQRKENREFMWDSNQDFLPQEPGPVLTDCDHTRGEAPGRCFKMRLRSTFASGREISRIQDTETEERYAQIQRAGRSALWTQTLSPTSGRTTGDCRVGPQAVGVHHVETFGSSTAALQRMILQLQRYDITMTHKPGKQIPVADALSRKPVECNENSK